MNFQLKHAAKLIVVALMLTALGSAAEFYVAPNGLPSGDGSIGRPWDLQTALNHPGTVKPGDKIWLRGGTYRGSFTSNLMGTAAAPIIVRQYPGERATVDGASSTMNTFVIKGESTWFWGFEVMNSDPSRVMTGTEYRPEGVFVLAPRIRVINMVIHDTGQGIGFWIPAVDAELYGNIIYYNGVEATTRGAGHGVYIQNNHGQKRIVDNVIFNGFSMGIQAYGSSASYLNNIYFEGNVSFANGNLSMSPAGQGYIIGGGVVTNNITMLNNYAYNLPYFYPQLYSRNGNFAPCYQKGCNNLTLRGNYSGGPTAIGMAIQPNGMVAESNVFIGKLGDSAKNFLPPTPNNVYNSNPPSPPSNAIFVRRNQYEPEKANVIIYNWAKSSSVAVNPSGVLQSGDRYEVHDVQNIFGQPLVTGTYTSGTIQIPMTSAAMSVPVGNVPRMPLPTSPEFGVFQVRKIASAIPDPPPVSNPTPIPTPTPTKFTVTLESESAAVTSPLLKASEIVSGLNYVTSKTYLSRCDNPTAACGLATFTINVPQDDDYLIWARVNAPNYAQDSFYVGADNASALAFDVAKDKWSNNWQWTKLNTRLGSTELGVNPRMLRLTKGIHTIKFYRREAGAALDKIMVTNDLSLQP